MTVPQPRDPNHPIYSLIDDHLERGDLKVIAQDLEVEQSTVSRVKRGRLRSARIWKRIIKEVMERKKMQDQFVAVMAGSVLIKTSQKLKEEITKLSCPPSSK